MMRAAHVFLLLAAVLTASCGLKINMPTLSDSGNASSVAALESGR